MAGPRIEVGAAVFCHQVRRAMCTACAWQACAWHLHGVCTAWACHGQAHVQARVRAQHVLNTCTCHMHMHMHMPHAHVTCTCCM